MTAATTLRMRGRRRERIADISTGTG